MSVWRYRNELFIINNYLRRGYVLTLLFCLFVCLFVVDSNHWDRFFCFRVFLFLMRFLSVLLWVLGIWVSVGGSAND